MTSRNTLRLTTAQALVLYLSKQYSVADGDRRRLIPAALGRSLQQTWALLAIALPAAGCRRRPDGRPGRAA